MLTTDAQNHDLDFGVPQFERLALQCEFPWLLANVLDPALGDDVPLGHARKTLMLTASNGLKIGLIGIAEREWLVTVNSLPANLIYQSASATAERLARELRAQGADMVIALTHQREPNDNKLAETVPAGLVDLVLGGHDHNYAHSLRNGTHVLRSGTDFRNLSYITAWRRPDSAGWDIDVARRDAVRDTPRDADAAAMVESISAGLRSKLDKPVGYTAAPLDARFLTVRRAESNLGNFVCDLMRLFYGADCAIMAAGTIRGDQVYPAGLLRARDIMNCFPFEDPIVVVQVTGQAILDALENGVSLYPALEGRFPQVSNIRFAFDARRPSGQRITRATLADAPIAPTQLYSVATRDYMARGKDGFASLARQDAGGTAVELVSDEAGVLLSALLRQYFRSLRAGRALRANGDDGAANTKSGTTAAAGDDDGNDNGRNSGSADALHAHFRRRVHGALHALHGTDGIRTVRVRAPAASLDEGDTAIVDGGADSALDDPSTASANLDNGNDDDGAAHPHDEHPSDSDSESEDALHAHTHRHAQMRKAAPPGQAHTTADHHTPASRRAMLARRYVRRWARLAGLEGRLCAAQHACFAADGERDVTGEGQGDGDGDVDKGEGAGGQGAGGELPRGMRWMRWTRAIAPRVEGRVECVGGVAV